MIVYCLHPKKPHENVHVESAVALAMAADASTSKAIATEGERVTCQFCTYLLQGALLGDCRVLRWIGSGAFGDVYEAEQLPPLNRRVAIKVMSLERVADGQSAELFTREVGAIAALDHPNILPVLRVGALDDGRSYLVMKYAAHGSLQKYCQSLPQELSILPTSLPVPDEIDATRAMEAAEQPAGLQEDDTGAAEVMEEQSEEEQTVDLAALETVAIEEREDEARSDDADQPALAEEKTALLPTPDREEQQTEERSALTPQQLWPFVKGAAAALQYAHEHSLVHLDVKPANLLLDAEDRVLLADFGVAAILDSYTHASLHCYVGTPVYTAPEQWLEQPRPASDQYALAVTCYQLLAGCPPFTGSLYSIMHGHLQLTPPSLRNFNPLVPQQIEAVLLKALAKEPEERYQDMRAFSRAYRDALEQAAGEQTDVNGQKHAGEERGREASELPALRSTPLDTPAIPAAQATAAVAEKTPETLDDADLRRLKQLASIAEHLTPARPRTRHMGRNLLIAVMVVALLSGGLLGVLRAARPCLLGVCPALRLSTSALDITNSDSQVVKLTNTGSADLLWRAAFPGDISWLSIAPGSGTLAPGKSAALLLKTNAGVLTSGVYTTSVQVAGQDIESQSIQVKLTVQTGLSQIAAQVSGTHFVYNQTGLHPASQTITISNKSARPFAWSLGYTKNTWLSVTPDQDTLMGGARETLRVSANVQSLVPSNNYTATVSLFGSLGQADPSILTQFNFTLEVQQTIPTVTPTALSTQVTYTFPTFSARALAGAGAPTTLRSQHSMTWDAQDDLLFVFGGIDDQGKILDDLWEYNPAQNQWTQISQASPPGASCADSTWPSARMNAALVWDSMHQQLLLYGGVGPNNHYLGDLWAYTPSSGAGAWKPLACSGNGPGPRAANAVWNGSQMLLLGGLDRYGPLADFWSYTPGGSGNGWQRLSDYPAGQRAYQAMAWDDSDNRLYVLGGLGADGLQHDDFYAYSAGSGWTQVAPATTQNPHARQQAMLVWDSKDSVLLLTGGYLESEKVPYWGLWAFDPSQNAWSLLTPLNSAGKNIIPGATASAMVYDEKDQEAFIYAGAGNGKTGSTLNGLWVVTSSS